MRIIARFLAAFAGSIGSDLHVLGAIWLGIFSGFKLLLKIS